MNYRWNEWNWEHVQKHGVTPAEVEQVIDRTRLPWPKRGDGEKWIVWGRGRGNRPIQVIYVLDTKDLAFPIHARPLTNREAKRYRKRSSR